MNMIEQVARAIAAHNGSGSYMAYTGEARAAIEAMRVPNEEMLAAGYIVTVDDELEVWETMIDAALK